MKGAKRYHSLKNEQKTNSLPLTYEALALYGQARVAHIQGSAQKLTNLDRLASLSYKQWSTTRLLR